MQKALAFDEGLDQRVIEILLGRSFDDARVVAWLRALLDQSIDFVVAQLPIAISGTYKGALVGSFRRHVARFVARGKFGNRGDEDGCLFERLDVYAWSNGGGKLVGAHFGQGILRALRIESGRRLEALFFGKAQNDGTARAV